MDCWRFWYLAKVPYVDGATSIGRVGKPKQSIFFTIWNFVIVICFHESALIGVIFSSKHIIPHTYQWSESAIKQPQGLAVLHEVGQMACTRGPSFDSVPSSSVGTFGRYPFSPTTYLTTRTRSSPRLIEYSPSARPDFSRFSACPCDPFVSSNR